MFYLFLFASLSCIHFAVVCYEQERDVITSSSATIRSIKQNGAISFTLTGVSLCLFSKNIFLVRFILVVLFGLWPFLLLIDLTRLFFIECFITFLGFLFVFRTLSSNFRSQIVSETKAAFASELFLHSQKRVSSRWNARYDWCCNERFCGF